MGEWIGWILETVQSVDPVVRTILTGVAIMLETSIFIGFIMPGDTVVIVGSTAVASPAEYFAIIVAVIIGALIGESIGFALGKYFGPRIRLSRLGARIGERNWIRAELFIARRGGIAVFVSRFLPVLHSLVPLTVGMSVMRYRRFIAWTLPACVIWAFAYVSVGTIAAGTYRELSSQLHMAGFAFAGIVIVFATVVFLTKKALEKSSARYMAAHVDSGVIVADEN